MRAVCSLLLPFYFSKNYGSKIGTSLAITLLIVLLHISKLKLYIVRLTLPEVAKAKKGWGLLKCIFVEILNRHNDYYYVYDFI